MSNKSNINMYYEEVVASMAERAQDDIDNGVEEYEAIATAIDDGLMYYTDQAYVLAFMLQGGFIRWGDTVDWDIIFENLVDDVSNEIRWQKEQKEQKEKENDN